MNKQAVKFTGYKIRKFLLEKNDNIPKEKQDNFNLECNSYQNDTKKNSYLISIKLVLYTKKSKLDLTLDGFFEIPENLNEDAKQNFVNISAPAILYPYARTFISNVTSFDADGTVVLPIINFADGFMKSIK